MLIFSLWLSTPTWADKMHLLNGDRLTGTIVKMEDRLLTLQTDYGGEIKIDWRKIQRLTSNGPLKIWVPADSHDVLRDFLYGARDLRELTELGPDSPVSLADITATNLEPLRLTGTVTADGNSTSGNSSTKALSSAALLMIQAHRQRLSLEGTYNYGLAGDQVTAGNSLVAVKRDFF